MDRDDTKGNKGTAQSRTLFRHKKESRNVYILVGKIHGNRFLGGGEPM
jgi:hypothetical protein